MNPLKQAAIDWVALAIQTEDPKERQPHQLAEALVDIAEIEDVPIEELVVWIHSHREEPTISTREFERSRRFEEWRDKK